MTAQAGFVLRAVEWAAPLDARRGVVRMADVTLQALGLRPWDPVRLSGGRVTGALVALAPPGTDSRLLLCDELTLRNLQVPADGDVEVRRAVEQPTRRLVLSGPAEVADAVPPELLRLALLGKVVTRGDQVSLLPQDFALPDGTDRSAVDRARRAIAGEVDAWRTIDLLAMDTDPAEPSILTIGTVVGWAGGRATDGSATPLVVPPPVLPQPTPASQPAAVVPGLEDSFAALREPLDLAFHRADLLARLGTRPQLGLLVVGPAGSGKASVVAAAAAATGAQVVRVWGPRLAGLDPAAAVAELSAAVQGVRARTPAVLLVEDVDALAPADQSRPAPLLGPLVDVIRALVADARVAVVCTTSQPEQVSPSLRGPGLLEREVLLSLPTRDQRRAMLGHLTLGMPLDADVALDDLAGRTPGFVLADLESLAREAALRAAHRQRDQPPDGVPRVAAVDFAAALTVVRPTALAGQALDTPDLTLDDVGDMAEVKQVLTETVLWPLAYPDTFDRLGVAPPHGVLLYGPPGCGKTFLIRALAGTGRANVLPVKGAELLSKWVGESERGVRELFQRARQAAPALIFLDEVDALAPPRGQGSDSGVSDRVVAALLTELDGIETLRDVVVVAATNRPDRVDPALLRPGRLDRLVYVAPPDAAARADILRAAARRTPLDPAVDLTAVAGRTEGYSAADLTAIIREAALAAMRESTAASTVTAAHVEQALATVRPSIRPESLAALQAFAAAQSAPASA